MPYRHSGSIDSFYYDFCGTTMKSTIASYNYNFTQLTSVENKLNTIVKIT